MPLVVGIDLGYGRCKIAAPGYRHSFRAVVAEPSIYSESKDLVEWQGSTYLIGDAALDEPHHRYATQPDKISRPEEFVKYMVALAMVSDHFDSQHLEVITGLPPVYYAHPGLKQQLVDRLRGNFRFRFQGRPYDVTIDGVEVDPQAGAAYFDAILRDDGTPDPSNADLLEGRTIVIDPGHRTTDICLLKGRKAAMGGRSLHTVNQGVWAAYEEAAKHLMMRYQVHKTPAEIDALVVNREELRVNGQPVPLENLLAEAVVPIAQSIVADVMRHSGDVRLWDRALLVGGGALLFHRVIAEELAVPVRIPRDPAFSNACGYFKRRMERRLAGM